MNITGTFFENADLFLEIGAGSSVITTLIRKLFPQKWEASGVYKRALYFFPVLSAALLLALIYFFPSGGVVFLHAVTIGGMSGNFRDLFKVTIERLAGKPSNPPEAPPAARKAPPATKLKPAGRVEEIEDGYILQGEENSTGGGIPPAKERGEE